MCFQVGRIDHYCILLAVQGGQTRHHPREDAFLAPTLPSAEERLVRAVSGRSVTPAQAITIDKDYAALHTLVVNARLSV